MSTNSSNDVATAGAVPIGEMLSDWRNSLASLGGVEVSALVETLREVPYFADLDHVISPGQPRMSERAAIVLAN